MPAHVKSSLLGASLTVPIAHGRMALGTWQVRGAAIPVLVAAIPFQMPAGSYFWWGG